MHETEQKIIVKERQRVKAKIVQGSKIVDPIVRVKFQNLEDPPAPGKPSPPFEFIFQTPKGLILSFKVSLQEEVPDTALRHGEIYELPLSVVDHLNNVQSPVYSQRHIADPLTGVAKIINFIAGYRNRFACTPVDMGEYKVIEQNEEKQKGPGRPSKKNEQANTNKELARLSSS